MSSYVPPHKRGLSTSSQVSNSSSGGGGNNPGSRPTTGRAAAQPQASLPTAKSLRDAAEVAHKKGDRKGELACYEEAVKLYGQALETQSQPFPAGSEEWLNCAFALAECLQAAGNLVLSGLSKLSDDSALILQQEQELKRQADALFVQAESAYRRVVTDESGSLREDAAVNLANGMCARADLIPNDPVSSAALLEKACELYTYALTLDGCKEDPAVYSNYADCLVSLGEQFCRGNAGARAEPCFERATQAYEASCSFTDSSEGDDLPGLLHSWGASLFRIAECITGNAEAKESFLLQAADKLKSSMDFARGDVDPMLALGDCFCSLGDLAAVSDPATATVHYRTAIEQGYEAALRLNMNCSDALVGIGEARMALGKLALNMGDGEAAASLFVNGASYYKQALQAGVEADSFEERCDVRYNSACALSLAGEATTALEILGWLADRRALNFDEAAADPDLANCRVYTAAWEQIHVKVYGRHQ